MKPPWSLYAQVVNHHSSLRLGNSMAMLRVGTKALRADRRATFSSSKPLQRSKALRVARSMKQLIFVTGNQKKKEEVC